MHPRWRHLISIKRTPARCLAYHINIEVQLKRSTYIPGPSIDMLYCFWTQNVELVFAMLIQNLRISVKTYPYFISLNLYNIPGKVSGYCVVPFFF